jgi:hypothetical protein
MTDDTDFERCWQGKLSDALVAVAGETICREVMEGGDALDDTSPRPLVIDWSKSAMRRLDGAVEEGKRRAIMTRCACRYPADLLQEARRIYAESGDVDAVITHLQAQFETFLRDQLGLDEGLLRKVAASGWGVAGMRDGNRIIATKIPRSANLRAYLEENQPEKRRALYCHCPRVRAALEAGDRLSSTYCYCGAGFYQGIWETITGKPVQVELLQSVMSGDDVCQVAITLS